MAELKPAYGAIAELYEQLMEVDYDEWAGFVLKKLREYSAGKRGADVGCGSGAFTRRFKRAGYDVTGFDLSAEMLARAIELTKAEGLSVQYVLQDMRSFKSMGKVDFITALTDCFNYVDGEGMSRALKRFAASLTKGGVLIFDVSTEYKLERIIGEELFGEDCDDYSYLWFNKPFDGGVEMDISLFTRREDGSYLKREEHHVQYIHTVGNVKECLINAGFDLKEVCGHLGEEIKEDCLRLNFIAVKRG